MATEAGSAKRAKPPQRSVVATDAQVPGPGRPKPVPKNVPIIHAHAGARVMARSVDVAAVIVLFLAILLFLFAFDALDVFGIGDWTGDDIRPAGPFSEIDQATPFATEWEVGVVAQDKSPTRRTAQADDLFLRHSSIVLDD